MKKLDLTLVFGTKKLFCRVAAEEVVTLAHLSQAVMRETQVEPGNQKLIYRGRTLFKPEDIDTTAMDVSLKSFGVKGGDRIMVLGRKAAEKKETVQSVVFDCDLSSSGAQKKDKSRTVNLADVIRERPGLPSNSSTATPPPQPKKPPGLEELTSEVAKVSERFDREVATSESAVSKDAQSLKSSKLILQGVHENAMKLLERVDGLQAGPGDDVGEYRARRKAAVVKLQSILDRCEGQLDQVKKAISQMDASNS